MSAQLSSARRKGRDRLPELLPSRKHVHPIYPDWRQRRALAKAADADIELCWACGACDSGCPVSIVSGRLRPGRTVRMAAFGMLDELLRLPDIWYCLGCRRCLHGCPNRVKPFELHRYLRNEAMARGIYAAGFIGAHHQLFSDFQRVRWRTAAHCFTDELKTMSSSTWHQWLATPLPKMTHGPIRFGGRAGHAAGDRQVRFLQGRFCFTCSECSGCCPITGDKDAFDPQRIIRMVNFGLTDQLLRSPAIWLCLGCRRCEEACSQNVKGHEIMRLLQRQAIDQGVVDRWFPLRLHQADRIIYARFLDEIDLLIGRFRKNL